MPGLQQDLANAHKCPHASGGKQAASLLHGGSDRDAQLQDVPPEAMQVSEGSANTAQEPPDEATMH